ncbi:Outer membrane receptor proteins, mostly Fe transport [Mucilaginibacter pineti]|uniref:Outer membrane receptor proteins, mostly Fe transport n=1 Tax=Mucilaginibacter pineti TaxID=1391627 RepID=A0A1G7H3X4_9SPHI|nr:outer membrane beta-barrel protein [Mucilaginibacter pineti]SDE95140.1 Outer membrane receptor proteins, mostly Fe transport [Mucilaginibacter pineti]
MTIFKYHITISLFIILLLINCAYADAQQHAVPQSAVKLKDALQEVSKTFHVSFMYETDLIDSKMVELDRPNLKAQKLETVLSELLQPAGISYYAIDQDNYALFKMARVAIPANPANSTGLQPSLPDTTRHASVSGVVIDEASHPLEYSTISLLDIDSSIVKSTLADSSGRYQFRDIMSGRYLVRATQMGYLKNHSRPFELLANGKVTVPPIILAASANQLAEVKITAKKPLFERRIDRTIVNVESSALATGGSISDVLEIAPGVSVDNNQISLKGKQGVTVMIDDKVVKLSASQISSLLQSMPASSISQIELISNPSAKYDAEGKGGIINIKTKKGTNLGFNGTITSGITVGTYPRFTEGLTLNYKLKRLNLFSNYSYQHNKGISQYLSDKIITGQPPLTYHQDETSHSKSDAHNARLGADYDLNDKNTIGILGTLNTNRSRSDFLQAVNFNNYSTHQRDSSLTSLNYGSGKYDTYGLNINSRHVLGPDGHLLLFNADYTSYRSANPNTYQNNYFDSAGDQIRSPENISNDAAVAIDLLTAKVDYSYPVNQTTKLEAGAKTAFTHSNSDILFQSGNSGGQLIIDTNRTNTFDYHENISALYINYVTKLGKQTDFQAGLRGENTHYSGKSLTTGQTVGRNYLQLFPSLFLLHNFGFNALSFSYSRRIGRPGYEDLNPFIDYSSPYFYSQGNPLLKPETTHSLELNYNYHTDLNISLGYSRTSDYYNYFTSLADSSGATKQTVANFKNYDTWNISISYNKELFKWWNLTANGDAFYDIYQTPYLGSFIDVQRAGYNFNILNAFQLTQKMSIEVLNLYKSKRVVLARTIDSKYRADVAFKYSLLDNKATIKLGVTDIFYTYINQGVNQFEGLYGTYYNRNENRRFNMSLSYKFGGKATAPKKVQSNKEELDRIK